MRSLDERTVLELAFEHLAVRQDYLALAMQVMVHEVALVKSLTINVATEAIDLVGSILRQH